MQVPLRTGFRWDAGEACHTTLIWIHIARGMSRSKPASTAEIIADLTKRLAAAEKDLDERAGIIHALLHGKESGAAASPRDGMMEEHAELRQTVAKYTPEEVERISGVPAAKLREAGRILAEAPTLVSTVRASEPKLRSTATGSSWSASALRKQRCRAIRV